MPDSGAALSPFELAAAAVEAWLDGAGAAFVKRTEQPGHRGKFHSWDIELQHATLGQQRARFSLPRDFPATPPQVHFNMKLCLVLPHIEEDGKFCHDVLSSPMDYDYPAGAAEAVLRSLEKFWTNTLDADWIQHELHKERLSYWLRFCDRFRTVNKVPAPRVVRAALSPLEVVTEGKVAAYFHQSQKLRSELMLATVGDGDPHILASRHRWPTGTLVRGHALFVPMPESIRWTPSDWPQSLQDLENLVALVTDQQCSVIHWIESKQDNTPHPFIVALVQEGICYGYLVTAAPVPRVTPPGVIPVVIDRVDADWALSRDHQLPVLSARREKRVLLLGCGSLGAPIAELLARAGIGELHLLDKEVFEPENCARHLLGACDVGLSKADALAKRLRQMVPGLNVRPYLALAASWVHDVCKPGNYDLVVDCTGESSVRVMLTHYRGRSLGPCSLVHAWVEPFCAAAHVVHLAPGDPWPANDPGEKVAAASWPARTRVDLPACGAGFHPYGAADVWQAAGFTAERLLAILDRKVTASTVWSWVRSRAFFESLGADVMTGPMVPDSGDVFESIQVSRLLKDVLGDG